MENLLSEYFKSINIADNLKPSQLNKIGEDVALRYGDDESERDEWLKINERGIKLAAQDSKGAKWAGQDSFDVMYPLISSASIQFAARAYPNIIKGGDVVKVDKPGFENGMDDRGNRISKYMNFQLINKIPSWPDEMDQLLFVLPVMGCHFKKTYQGDMGVVSENVPAADLCIPYKAKSLKDAPQITQIIVLSQNDVVERQRTGKYRDMDLVNLGYGEDEKDEQIFLEQHCWIDLDSDGYKEPYIVVIHKETHEVMRISTRFNLEGIHMNDKEEVYKIDPVNHYTRYLFMPAFDGSVYGMGFGRLLGPINTTVNSVINQLLDAGSLYTRQGGFIGKDVRLGTNQSMYFKVGEWKHVNYRGDDLRKNIVPLPAHEPSTVLYQLLGTMVEAGKEMSSVSELLSGEQRQSNVPAATTLALIEQGLKVFSGIYKRIYRSLKSEIDKIRKLNYLYLGDEEYINVLNIEAKAEEDFYPDDYDVIPLVDETEITELQKLARSKELMELRGQGLNDIEIIRRHLEALNIPNPELIIPEKQEPDPKEEAEVSLTFAKADRESADAKLATEKVNSEIVEQQVSQAGVQLDAEKLKIEKARTVNEIKNSKIEAKQGAKEGTRKLASVTPTSKQRKQKSAYREVGMKSDNKRRKEQVK